MMRAAPDRNWTVLGPQLDRLLSLSEVDQAQWLADLAQRDAANAGQLRSLLSARDAASRADFLADESAPEILPAQAQAGERLGAWRLMSLLGEGGMGTVWLAVCTDGRYGQAAIKLLRTGLFDASSEARRPSLLSGHHMNKCSPAFWLRRNAGWRLRAARPSLRSGHHMNKCSPAFSPPNTT